MTLDIRPWQPGDETAIQELFQTVFGRTLAPDFWNWRFKQHPAGGPLIMLAWVGDRLASHYAAAQCPLFIDGRAMRGALSMTSMTHPEFRSMGLFEKTGLALYSQLSEQGYAATWGFPNTNINVHRQKKLGWLPVSDVSRLSLSLPRDGILGFSQDLGGVIETDKIDARFGRHTARMLRQDTVQLGRDTETLAWRVDQNPVNQYIRLVLPDGDEIAGYAILKRWQADEIDIVDMSADDEEALQLVLRAAIAKATYLGASKVNTWCLNRDERRLPLERIGLNATGPVTYMGVRALDPSLKNIDDPRRWRISMLDSDLY